MSQNKIFLAQPWGGLGDQLAYSNLPRLYAEQGYEFNLSFMNHSRNKEITKYVWKNNKFVKRINSIHIPNAGYMMFNKKIVDGTKYNAVQTINVLHGFKAGEGYPEINIENVLRNNAYYENIVDLNAISLFHTQPRKYDPNYLSNLKRELNNNGFINLKFPNIYNLTKSIDNDLEINSLEILISTLLNTENFHCLNSGSHSLAATLKYQFGSPKNIICYRADYDKEIKDLGYRYKNIEYRYIPTIVNENYKYSKKTLFYQRLLNYFS